jgi:hypothetical protein
MARKKTNNRPKLTDNDVKKIAKFKKRAEMRYVFPDGTVVTIQRVATPLIYRLQSDAGKPTPEKFKEVRGVGDTVMRVPDESDPDYQAAVAEWEISKVVNFAETMILEGIKEQPPDEVIQRYWARGIRNLDEIKYRWIAEKLWNPDAETDFYNTMMGLSIETEDGVAEATATFPGDVPGSGGQDSTGDGVDAAAEEAKAAAPD